MAIENLGKDLVKELIDEKVIIEHYGLDTAIQ